MCNYEHKYLLIKVWMKIIWAYKLFAFKCASHHTKLVFFVVRLFIEISFRILLEVEKSCLAAALQGKALFMT